MVNTCVVYGCQNRADDDVKNVFYEIPNIRLHEGEHTEQLSKHRRRTWISRINRRNFTPSTYSKVCADHFLQGTMFVCVRCCQNWPNLKSHFKFFRNIRCTIERSSKQHIQFNYHCVITMFITMVSFIQGYNILSQSNNFITETVMVNTF